MTARTTGGCDSSADDELSHAVFAAFQAIANRQRRMLHRELARQDLHPAQARCLRLLTGHGSLGQSELADALDVSRPTVTRIVQRMERDGLVLREPDPRDQRQTIVSLTGRGRELERCVGDALARHVLGTVSMLPEHDRRELARILRVWEQHVEQDTTSAQQSSGQQPGGQQPDGTSRTRPGRVSP